MESAFLHECVHFHITYIYIPNPLNVTVDITTSRARFCNGTRLCALVQDHPIAPMAGDYADTAL
jgi:hypothetical protein